MSLVLYRKYRPQSFSEVIGQDHIIETLRGGVSRDKISHAYLFNGPRGTGKTTVARILAKVLNCEDIKQGEPCNKCRMCGVINKGEAMDIIEVDAASNRGIDEIRALREGIRFTPSVLKYKVFIIDEVHMLTKESFNALLKTLEEPPSHAVFILATTEIHKVLPTILSRCQRFDFRRLKLDKMTDRLKFIAKAENIKIDNEALRFIGVSSDGCMRDAESLLGQIVSLGDKKIDLEDMQDILGVADIKTVFDFFDNIFAKDYGQSLSIVNSLVDRGIDIQYFLQDLVNHLRKLIFIKVYGGIKKDRSLQGMEDWTDNQRSKALVQIQDLEPEDLLKLLNMFVGALDDLRKFPLPQMALEVAALEAIGALPDIKAQDHKNMKTRKQQDEITEKQNDKRIENTGLSLRGSATTSSDVGGDEAIFDGIENPRQSRNPREPKRRPAKKKQGNNSKKSQQGKKSSAKGEKKRTIKHKSTLSIEVIRDHWNDVLKEVKPHNNSLFAFLGASLPQKFDDNVLTIAAKYNFHKERLEERSNRLIIEKVLEEVFDKKIKVKCVLDQDLSLPKKIGEGAKDLVSSALKIFGGKVVE